MEFERQRVVLSKTPFKRTCKQCIICIAVHEYLDVPATSNLSACADTDKIYAAPKDCGLNLMKLGWGLRANGSPASPAIASALVIRQLIGATKRSTESRKKREKER